MFGGSADSLPRKAMHSVDREDDTIGGGKETGERARSETSVSRRVD
jgi:hypothetical protein